MSGSWKHSPWISLAIGAISVLACIQPVQAAEQPLKVVGFHKVMERAPMALAVEMLPPGSVTIGSGAIPSLWPGVVDSAAPGARTEKGAVPPDLAGNAETQALRQSVMHPDLRILMTITEGMYRTIARKSSGIQNLADLKGKRIATINANSSAFYLHKMLARVGLTEADVTIVPAQADKGADMLIAGEVDALATYEPEPERARLALGANAVEFNEFGAYRELYNLNTTTATLNNPVKRRQTVAYVRALLAACHEATYNPARAQQLVAESSGFDLKLVEAAWRHHNFTCSLPTDVLDVLVDEEKWVAAQEKRAPRDRAQLAALIDPSILTEAQKAIPAPTVKKDAKK
jgi:NitT/TauT family transport system substrate-binding protein